MFESTGCIDEHVLLKLKKHLIPKARIWYNYISSVVVAMIAIYLIVYEKYVVGVLFLIGAVLTCLEIFILRNRAYKACLGRLQETSGESGLLCRAVLDEDGCTYYNLKTGGSMHLDYSLFVKVREFDDFFYMGTKAKQFIIVFKDGFDKQTRREFRKFIIDKCEKIDTIDFG